MEYERYYTPILWNDILSTIPNKLPDTFKGSFSAGKYFMVNITKKEGQILKISSHDIIFQVEASLARISIFHSKREFGNIYYYEEEGIFEYNYFLEVDRGYYMKNIRGDFIDIVCDTIFSDSSELRRYTLEYFEKRPDLRKELFDVWKFV